MEKRIELMDLTLEFVRAGCRPFYLGGSALLLMGAKRVTLDVDLLATSRKELEVIDKTLSKKLAATRKFVALRRGKKKTGEPYVYIIHLPSNEELRIDVFFQRIFRLHVSQAMVGRAVGIGDALVPSKEDLVLMKLVSGREKTAKVRKSDIEDVLPIIPGLEWGILIEEVRDQKQKYGENAVPILVGDSLEKIKYDYEGDVPTWVLDELWKMVGASK